MAVIYLVIFQIYNRIVKGATYGEWKGPAFRGAETRPPTAGTRPNFAAGDLVRGSYRRVASHARRLKDGFLTVVPHSPILWLKEIISNAKQKY